MTASANGYADSWGPVPGADTTIVGSIVEGVGADALPAAITALAAVTNVNALDIRAGEHIAGLVLTAFNGPPSAVDTDGGPDFVFIRDASSPWNWSFGDAPTAAVEVKSTAGGFRRFEAKASIGDSYSVTVRPVAEVLISCTPLIQRAQQALDAKARPTWSRHIFLIAHLFDAMPLEGFELEGMFLGYRLPCPGPWLTVDSLWVLFQGVGIARWSRVDERWSSLVLGARYGDQPRSPNDGADLELAEQAFLEAIKHVDGSPWRFGLDVETGD